MQIFQGVQKLKQGKPSASVLHDLAVDFVENAGALEAHLKYAKRLFATDFPERLMQTLQVRHSAISYSVMPDLSALMSHHHRETNRPFACWTLADRFCKRWHVPFPCVLHVTVQACLKDNHDTCSDHSKVLLTN